MLAVKLPPLPDKLAGGAFQELEENPSFTPV